MVGIVALIALLADQDSYVYLSVLRVISKLADINRSAVFFTLLDAFSNTSTTSTSASTSSLNSSAPGRQSVSTSMSIPTENDNDNISKNMITTRNKNEEGEEQEVKNRFKMKMKMKMDDERAILEGKSEVLSLRHRALIGEALSDVLKRAGEAAPPFVQALIAACIKIVRVRASKEEEMSLEDFVNLKTMTIAPHVTIEKEKEKKNEMQSNVKEVEEGSGKVERKRERNEVEVERKKESEEISAERKREREVLVAAHNADIALLRQSAISLLAEAVVCAGWIASNFLSDILDIATHVLALEGREHFSQTSSVMRR